MSCRKCGCKEYKHNLVSAAQKFFSGSSAEVKVDNGVSSVTYKAQGMPYQDNKSDQVAYRNCKCGHHKNYHDGPQ